MVEVVLQPYATSEKDPNRRYCLHSDHDSVVGNSEIRPCQLDEIIEPNLKSKSIIRSSGDNRCEYFIGFEWQFLICFGFLLSRLRSLQIYEQYHL
jgi:hypothetical protein